MKPTRPEAPAAADYSAQLASLLELEQRHDELLGQLEALDARVERVLAEWSVSRAATGGSGAAGGEFGPGPASGRLVLADK
jgi:hypothetical protein